MLAAPSNSRSTPPVCLFDTRVLHRRLKPFGHCFRYSIWQLLIDIDRLDELDRISPLLGVDRTAPIQFRRQDHGARDGSSLRGWAMRKLRYFPVPQGGWGRFQLLCMPRVLGMGFNPLSIWYCEDGLGRIAAMIWEVSNTFGEAHCYVIPNDPDTGLSLRQSCDKAFYVSPFIGMKQRYTFRTARPDDRMRVIIHQQDEEGGQMVAAMTGNRKPLSTSSLSGIALAQPLLPVKVLGAIHWQAFRLWLKGAAYYPRMAHTAQHKPQTKASTALRNGARLTQDARQRDRIRGN
ncbi:MAG: DUF1365 domain-containing protein [Alphaproteobacteria bacterium]